MRRRLLAVVALACAAAALTEVVAARGNTLVRNGAWRAGKMGLARGVMGAVAFYVTRPPLAGDQLDLGAYFGFQEVTYAEPLALDEIAFRFRLDDGAVLAFLYGGGERGFEAVRLGRAPDVAEWVRVAPDGEFTARGPLA